ncbi:hypothetical protein K2Z83_13550 [Oscillochloris sp. ZM17-4]|uniref:hypothetical protein n=1 Tax=Oscillochloris sp. ZM17-4 TaxID=2866714 RepID=UPI001C738FB2|nr:hypothetical protein [Oscillochloris sp. ZM17-4]MBX0328702.1 hypothetical protein [Oscillochloris sp. ZM17-4]
MQRILARLAAETGQGAEAHASRRTGFMASTVGSTPPNTPGHAGFREKTVDGDREAVAQPAAGPYEAYAFVAAAYALFVELKQPFLLPAAQAALANIDRILAEEGV